MNSSRSVSRSPQRATALPLAALGLTLLLSGCSGSDGDRGPAGPAGPGGGTTNPTSTEVVQGKSTPGMNLTILSLGGATGAGGNYAVGDRLVVTYTLKKNDGTDWDLSEMNFGRILVSGPSFNYQRVIPEVTNLATASVQNTDGSYTYTFASGIPATYAAPYNDTASFDADDGELTGQTLLGGTYTVGMYFGWNFTVGEESYRDAANAEEDFLFGVGGTLAGRDVVGQDNCNVCHTTLQAHGGLRRDVKLCVLCHTAGSEDRNTSTVAGGTPGQSIEFKVMIHRIHNGAHLPSVLGITTNNDGTLNYAATPVPNEYLGFQDSLVDLSEVTFPVWPNFNISLPKDEGYSQLSGTDPDGSGPLLSPRSRNDGTRRGVTACAKCHGDPDASGPLQPPAQGTLYRAQPSERACGSCHDDVRWGFPYTSNGQTMPDTADDTNCTLCHTQSGDSISVDDAHLHPLLNPSIDPGVNTVITGVTGGTGTGGNFQIGDTPTLTFSLKNDAGDDVGLSTMDSAAGFFFGPNENRQLVMPLTSANGMSLNPFDFSGRLQAVSTTNKGTMSKVFQGSPAVEETLTVEFTTTTTFSVTGSTSGALGTGTLPAAASTNPSGSSISGIELDPLLSAGTIQIAFSDATHFTVTATPGGTLGTGTLPASTSSSTRFTSTSFSCNVVVGTSVFAAGNTFQIGLFRGGAANPVLFAVVAGRTAFSATAGAPDRFYFGMIPDAATYTFKMPMDMQYEFLGDSTSSVGQVLQPGNVPVHYGRQQLWEATTSATTTTTLGSVDPLDRQIDVSPATGFAGGDVVAIEPTGGVGTREYLQITPAKADGTAAASGDTTTRIYVRTPLRYAHSSGVTITKVTLALKQEGSSNAYVLTSGTSTPGSANVTSNVAFTAGAGLVMTYRTDARFGYKRHFGDSVQAYYVPPANDTIAIGQEQGDWQGLPYLDGTYTADLWIYKNIELGLYGEAQTYRSTSNAGTKDFLYGAATTIVPHEVISSSSNCYTCHNDVLFHGGGRRGLDACLTCHGISGGTNTVLPGNAAIEFRQMLHKIHRGAELPDAATYPFATAGEFPAMPGGVRNCVRCHGNEAWKQPSAREHGSAEVPVRVFGVVCGSCHSSEDAQAHIDVKTTTGGAESCGVCHGPGREWSVERMHKAY